MFTKKTDKPKATAKAPTKRSRLSDFLHGRWLSSRFFAKYWSVILAVMVMLILYIATRYQCTSAMEEIQRLEKRLQVVESEQVREKAFYMTNTRETAMTERIKAIGLDLEVRERPPFHISLIP